MIKNQKLILVFTPLALLMVAGILFAFNSEKVLGLIGSTLKDPIFVFSQDKAPDWWAAKNYNAQESANEEEYQRDSPIDKLPVASIHAFKGIEGDGRTDCFVSLSYYDYKTDLSKLKAEKDAGMPSGDFSMNEVGQSEASLTIFGGSKTIIMNNYELSGAGSENSMKGMSYGWIEGVDGYIEVSGVCPTANELGQVADVTPAISLVKQ